MSLPKNSSAPPSIPSWARVGAKVVCVDDTAILGSLPLSVGSIYTIVGVTVPPKNKHRVGRHRRAAYRLLLADVTNPLTGDGAFGITRFRPLITKSQEQDVAIFRHLLDTTRADA